MKTLITIETTRYSEALRRILTTFAKDAEVRITYDRARPETFRGAEVQELIENWCTNERITKTRNFSLRKSGVELFGFHDHPKNFWADISTMPFIQGLAAEKVVRYKVSEVRSASPWAWFQRMRRRAEQSAPRVPGSRGTPPAGAGVAPRDPAGEP